MDQGVSKTMSVHQPLMYCVSTNKRRYSTCECVWVTGLVYLFYLSLILIFWSVCGSYMNLISCRWRIGGKVRNLTPFSASCITNKHPNDIHSLTFKVYINTYVKSFNALQPHILFTVPACLCMLTMRYYASGLDFKLQMYVTVLFRCYKNWKH